MKQQASAVGTITVVSVRRLPVVQSFDKLLGKGKVQRRMNKSQRPLFELSKRWDRGWGGGSTSLKHKNWRSLCGGRNRLRTAEFIDSSLLLFSLAVAVFSTLVRRSPAPVPLSITF